MLFMEPKNHPVVTTVEAVLRGATAVKKNPTHVALLFAFALPFAVLYCISQFCNASTEVIAFITVLSLASLLYMTQMVKVASVQSRKRSAK